jgi:nucleolar GTP-binding protein
MDVDVHGGADGEDAEQWMDVDGEEQSPPKRTKTNSGAIVAAGRQPRTNRQFAGMRDEVVRAPSCSDRAIAESLGITANEEGDQATQPRAKRAELAGEGGRERSCDQDEDGPSLVHVLRSRR